jgi:hypothetical protein
VEAEVADPDFGVDGDALLLQPATDAASIVAASGPTCII